MNKDKLLTKYLNAELSEKQKQSFYQYLDTDAEFAEDVKIHSLLYAQRSKKFKEYLSDVETTTVKYKPDHSYKHTIKILSGCAAVFVLALISYFIYSSYASNRIESLVDEYYFDAYQAPGNLSSSEQNIDIWEQAVVYYSDKDYEAAIEEILKIDQLSIEQKLYLSLSEMYVKPPKLNSAIERLEVIYEDLDNIHQDATSWYLSLAYLKFKQEKKAKPILIQISESKHYKSAEANQLVKQIESI